MLMWGPSGGQTRLRPFFTLHLATSREKFEPAPNISKPTRQRKLWLSRVTTCHLPKTRLQNYLEVICPLCPPFWAFEPFQHLIFHPSWGASGFSKRRSSEKHRKRPLSDCPNLCRKAIALFRQLHGFLFGHAISLKGSKGQKMEAKERGSQSFGTKMGWESSHMLNPWSNN